tara:strand:+ start:336 stop:533 length:198 start_codon:yes stop_codon:yes gene_type:complete
MKNTEIIKSFLNDYNALLEGLNDELDGIEDIGKNKMAKKMSDVELANLECDDYLLERFHEIKESN